MRVAFVTFQFPPSNISGAGIYAEKVTNALTKSGVQVAVFTPNLNDAPKRESSALLEIVRVPVTPFLPFKALQFWLKLPAEIQKAEKQKKFDIIHFNGISYWFLKKRLSSAPHIITIHHLVTDTLNNLSPSFLQRIYNPSGEISLFEPLMEKRCIKFSDKIVAVSLFTKKQIIKTYCSPENKISVVYNGADLDLEDFGYSVKDLEETTQRYSIQKDPVILFVGNFDDPRKGFDMLLFAFKKVITLVDSTLLVVGNGRINKFTRLINELGLNNKVKFIGYASPSILRKCYALCSMIVCPSRLEGFGLVLLEAIAACKPIVTTDVGAIPEILANYPYCRIVKSEHIDGLSDAIVEILKSPFIIDRFICQQKIQKYTWENSCASLISIYSSMTNKKK